MSFDAVLRTILDDCGDALGVALTGVDGIPIEEIDVSTADDGVDISALGVEFGRILSETRKAGDSVGGGALEELSLRLSRFWVVLRVVDTENFLLLALPPDGNVGKARFVLRRHVASICAEF